MMTSSNGNIFRVTGPLCGEFTGPGEFPTQRPVTRSFDVFFDLRLNKRLSKQNREAGDLSRHCGHYDVIGMLAMEIPVLHLVLDLANQIAASKIDKLKKNPTMHLSHIQKAPFRNRNVHTCAHFWYKIVHCGIFVWCTVGFWDVSITLCALLWIGFSPFQYHHIYIYFTATETTLILMIDSLASERWGCDIESIIFKLFTLKE